METIFNSLSPKFFKIYFPAISSSEAKSQLRVISSGDIPIPEISLSFI